MPGKLIGPITGFTDRMKGKGMSSSAFLTQIGASSAQSTGGGNIYSGLTPVSNGADTTADTLFSATLPANLFDVVGRCVTLQLFGSVSATSATKTVNFVFGGSISQSIVQYTTTNTGSWQAFVQIFKTGANTQIAMFQADASGTTASVLGLSAGRALTIVNGTETDTASIVVKVTGQSSVATAGLVTCSAFIVDAYN